MNRIVWAAVIVVVLVISWRLIGRFVTTGGTPQKANSKRIEAPEKKTTRVNVVSYAAMREAVSAEDSAGHLREVIGIIQNPMDYFDLVLRRGGTLILTQGNRYMPVGRLTVKKGGLKETELPSPFKLPSGLARDVSSEVKALNGGKLPLNASRALLFWPEAMHQSLQRKLADGPFKGAVRFEARYETQGDRLMVVLTRFFAGGRWEDAGGMEISL